MKIFILSICAFICINFTTSILGSDNLLGCPKTLDAQIIKTIIKNSYNYVGNAKIVLIGGVIVVASYALYSYFTRFNSKDAHLLVHKIHEFTEATQNKYKRELSLLMNNSDLAGQGEELKVIILDSDSPVAYLDYVTEIIYRLNQVCSFLKIIEDVIPKLKSYCNNLTSNNSCQPGLLIHEYENTIAELDALRKKLSVLTSQLSTLSSFCSQDDLYKQDMKFMKILAMNKGWGTLQYPAGYMPTMYFNMPYKTTYRWVYMSQLQYLPKPYLPQPIYYIPPPIFIPSPMRFYR